MGLAAGLTGALLYLGCILVMFTVGHQGTVAFFNSLFHGVDVASIIRMNVPGAEAVIGIAETFILFWLMGACVAAFYNLFTTRKFEKFLKENRKA